MKSLDAEIAEAASLLRAAVPVSGRFVLSGLGVNVKLADGKWVKEWSVRWDHISGAYGTVEAEGTLELASITIQTLQKVEDLALKPGKDAMARRRWKYVQGQDAFPMSETTG